MHIALLRELIMMEQFNDQLGIYMRNWLIDQKPTSLTKLAKLTDQYIAAYRVEYINKSSKGSQFQKSQTRKKW